MSRSKINFCYLVEATVSESDIKDGLGKGTKTFKDVLASVIEKVYKTTKPVDINSYVKDFIDGQHLSGSGYMVLKDFQIKQKPRFIWPLLDTGWKIFSAMENEPTAFNELATNNTKTLDDVIKGLKGDPNYIKQEIIDAIVTLNNKSGPESYSTFANQRLQKLSSDLSHVTIQAYNNRSILDTMVELTKIRGFENKKTVKDILTAPFDYLRGRITAPTDVDQAVFDIGGALANYFRKKLEAAGAPANDSEVMSVGTRDGLKTGYGQGYVKFIEGNPTPAPGIFANIKTVGDLMQEAPDVYALIQNYSQHIKRGDIMTKSQKAARVVGGIGSVVGGIARSLAGFRGI